MLVLLIGVLFLGAGVLIASTGDIWTSLMTFLLGATFVIFGVGKLRGTAAPATRMTTILSGALFALAAAVVLVASLVDPDGFGRDDQVMGVVLGAVGLALFGSGTVLLIIKEKRQRRVARQEP